MAVARQEQTLLIKLVISMLGIAPGSAYLPVVEKGFEDLGRNLSDTATALAGLPQFKALYPAGMTGAAFASQFLAGMGLQSDAGLHRLAADLFNAGTSPQQIILAAVQALESPTLPPQYAAARGLLENKAQVAYYHAQILGRAETDFAALAKVLGNVTQDPASVEAAKQELNPPPTPEDGGGGVPQFAVTKGVGDIASFTHAGTQISVAEAGGTFTFTSSAGTTGTATLAGPLAGIAVPAGSTLTISSPLANGKVFSGAGTALVVALATGEDLTGFAGSGVGGFVLTSGQNYTLTAAQAAIGRIGANGAAGTLTDAGTTTVRDTLAALGGGVAATLKAHGADSVIASATPGDIATTAIAGIDSIVLAGGNYTMTAAQAALADGTAGTQTVTVTSQATGVLPASVENFVLGNFANNVGLGAAGQNISSPAGTATTLAIAGTAATGTWLLANGADLLVATDGASIAGVNGGAATTAENLDLTGGITMTAAQYASFYAGAITATGGSDRITLTTALTGGQVLNAAIENFTLAAANNMATLGAAQSIDARALTAGQTLSLAGAFAASVALANGDLSSSATGNLTVTGGTGANTISLGVGNDTVNAGDGNDVITGGAGVDTLHGEGGDDSFLYASLGEFITGNAVVDLIDGGSGTDAVVITGAITLTTASDLRRMSSVEQINAQAQSATTRSHTIVANSDTLLSGVTAIDLSGDKNGSSSGNFDLRGVTQGMALKGVGAGTNSITGGSGVDTLVGGNGTDSFYYHDAASFISGTAVVDSIDGGNGNDAIEIRSGFSVSSTQSLDRITNVEVLRAQDQTGSNRTYALTFLSDANLGSISQINLSFDRGSGSAASIDISGATRAMTVNGVKSGTNKIFAGQGADILQGGSGTDYFFFNSAAHAAGDIVTGGGGTDYAFFASTAGETLQITNNFAGISSYWITTDTRGPGFVTGTTSENIDASAYTLGNLVLNGSAGNNKITGGAGNDNFIGNGGTDVLRGGGGNDTLQGQGCIFQFEATAAANGQDTISSLVGGKLDFTFFLGGAGSVAASAVHANDPTTLLLNGANNIGVRFGSTTVSVGDITTSTANEAGKISLANDGKAVVLAFNSATADDMVASNGRIYYVWDADSSAATDFQVSVVGTLTFGTMSAASMATAAYYI